ncbi:fungal-specific transcription factor domain-containing protein [Mycena crocata]|nr:fungal-specific transcription factor domain-containing protein [Mycena crocata]
MSGTEESLVPGSKRRRLRGSCDICKQRKIRCDSAQMPGKRCSNCIAFNSECSHSSSSKPTPKKAEGSSKSSRSPSKPDAIEQNPSTAQAHVAAIVVQATAYIAEADVRQVLLDVARYARSLETQLTAPRHRSPSVPSSGSGTASSESPMHIKEEEDDAFVNGILTERFDRFKMDSDSQKYFGKSSHFELINTAIDIKENWGEGHPVPEATPPPSKRPEFWMSPWEHKLLAQEDLYPPLVFPEPDLLQSLVSLYFSKVHIVACLLHRPTFEKSIAAGLHLTDHQFGSTVLAVCALASKYSDDPRVILEGTNTRLSSGWKYFRQLQPIRLTMLRSFTLYEAQVLCLYIFYLQGSSAPDGCWALGGAGVRCAQEVGVHRGNRFDDKVEAEHWKRVFWILICIDTMASSFCGRPRATFSDDYDVALPLEVDDEYWITDDPEMAFKQPPGKPSIVSYSIAYYKLIEILGMAQKTIYLVSAKNKSNEWMLETVASLDSALNAWVDSVPVHLRWDPHREDPTFATQSAVLYACYYHVQIQVHRVFVTSPGARPIPTPCTLMAATYPSLAIAVSSARACAHVMEVASRRGFLCNPHILNAVFDSCIMLLLNIWGGRQVGLNVDPQKCMQDVESCLRIFRAYESRWQIAGRQHDIITQLMSATNVDFQYTPNPLKRGLDRDPEPSSSVNNSELQQSLDIQEFSNFFSAPTSNALELDPLFSLPIYTEDLGRLPIYEPLNWNSWGKDSQDGVPLPGEIQNAVTPSGTLFPDLNNVAVPDFLSTGTPAGYDWDHWSKYITSVEELMHSLDNPGQPAG